MYFILWVFCILTHKILSDYVYNLGMSIQLNKTKPLYDIIQMNSLNLQSYRILPEILHLIPVLYLIFMIISNKKWNVLNSFFKNHGILMLFRSICFTSTLLPDSSQMCKNNNYLGSCFDLIFSGHSTIMLLSTYLLKYEIQISNKNYYALQFNNLITFLLIILCRNHYTIDIVLSIVLTHLVYFYKDNSL
jgi:hypothetical protein